MDGACYRASLDRDRGDRTILPQPGGRDVESRTRTPELESNRSGACLRRMAPSEALVARLAVVVAVVLSVLVVRRVDRSGGRSTGTLRSRFVLGVPWGTLLVVGFVLFVYLFVQRGIDRWNAPLVLPFRAWSYLYPLGTLAAPFSHANSNHLVGNLTGTLVLAPIAEYVWGHYPRERGARAFSSVRTNPYARVLAFFGAVVSVGIATSLFALGPVIGFSGVVFAFAGVALVRYPLVTVIALAASNVLGLVRSALADPVTVARAEPGFSSPWWAQIAIQGHALGLLLGIVCGVFLLRRRGTRPPAFRIWLGVLVFAVGQSLWAVYWYRGNQTFVLFRAAGTVLVFALATLVALGVAASERPLSERIDLGVSRRGVATAVLVAVLLGVGLPAVPFNFTTVADPGVDGGVDSSAGIDAIDPGVSTAVASTEPGRNVETGRNLDSGTHPVSGSRSTRPAIGSPSVGGSVNGSVGASPPVAQVANGVGSRETVRIRGYAIRYAEDVPNRLVSVVDVSALGETTAVNTSGVIVVNENREIWTADVSKPRLAFAGEATVRVGGLGWERTVAVRRTGWTVAGGNTTYKVFLRPDGENRRLAYVAEPATAEPILDDKDVSIAPAAHGYEIVVAGNGTTARTPVPANDESTTAGGITFERDGPDLVATYDGTRIPIAERETYR